MIKNYILVGTTPVAEPDFLKWATWFETADRCVCRTIIALADLEISTVFLAIDHAFFGGEPLLFETMVFRVSSRESVDDFGQRRCSTWDQANAQHDLVVAKVVADRSRQ